jgi:hypothetical protein
VAKCGSKGAAKSLNNITQKHQLITTRLAKNKKEIVIAGKFHNNGSRCATQTKDMTTHYF